MSRPLEMTSTVAASSATFSALFSGRSSSHVPILMRVVRAAMAAATVSGDGL